MVTATRPRRSALYMPGANQRALAKAQSLPADVLLFDLEDAVAPDAKPTARENVVAALAERGSYGHRELVVRVNALDTPWGHADLVALAPHVLFSAAVPGQGGNNHINEQWQSYWADRFAAHGYGPRDIVRPAVRDDRSVAYWYRQNAVLYSKGFPTERAVNFDWVHAEHTAWYRLIHRRMFGGLPAGTILRPS